MRRTRDHTPWLARSQILHATFLSALLGCLPRYQPGALAGLPETQVIVGCVDLQWELLRDPLVPPSHVALRFAFGNRCDRVVPLDFARVRVVARGADAEAGFALVDPRGEVAPASLEAHLRAQEVLEYAPVGVVPGAATTLCVDAGGLAVHVTEVPRRCVPWRPPAPPEETAP